MSTRAAELAGLLTTSEGCEALLQQPIVRPDDAPHNVRAQLDQALEYLARGVAYMLTNASFNHALHTFRKAYVETYRVAGSEGQRLCVLTSLNACTSILMLAYATIGTSAKDLNDGQAIHIREVADEIHLAARALDLIQPADLHWRMVAWSVLAECHLLVGDYDKADEFARTAEEYFAQIEAPTGTARGRHGLHQWILSGKSGPRPYQAVPALLYALDDYLASE